MRSRRLVDAAENNLRVASTNKLDLKSQAANRNDLLKAAVSQVECRWKTRLPGRMTGNLHEPLNGLETGLPALDQATGFGGIPRGKLTEFTGSSSSGKLTLALRALATSVAAGGLAVYVDLPGTFYPPAAAAMEIDLERLVIVRPTGVLDAVKAASILLLSEGFETLLVDFGSACIPSNSLARLTDLSARSQTATMVVTRIRPAGIADGQYIFASLRLGVERCDWLWQDGLLGRVPIGMNLNVSVLKSRSAAPEHDVKIDCYFNGSPAVSSYSIRQDVLPSHQTRMPQLGSLQAS